MSGMDLTFDTDAALARLPRFLSVEGITGQEREIGREVVRALAEEGIPRRAMTFDRAHERIPVPTQTGNLIVTLPGTAPGTRRLFMTHLDTVPLCAGAVPLLKGDRIVAAGNTALGGDNRTGVACLATLLATLVQRKPPHPPLTALFTVREESGLCGARHVDPAELGDVAECYNVDGRSPAEVTVGAVGADRWEVDIYGRAAHAGVHPEQGISATLVAALALAEISREGWFGKVRRDGKEGTSNVGIVGDRQGRSAGVATNVVTDYAYVKGESRSHDQGFITAITRAYRDAFRSAARQVTNDRGRAAKVAFRTSREYYPFRLKPTSQVVRHAEAAVRTAGLRPSLRVSNGGLDANWLVRHGIPTITIGAGQHEIHTVDEFVDVKEYLDACRVALALAMQGNE